MVKTNLDAMQRSLSFRVLLGPSGPTIQWRGASDNGSRRLVDSVANQPSFGYSDLRTVESIDYDSDSLRWL
jgi:hypothetical protein